MVTTTHPLLLRYTLHATHFINDPVLFKKHRCIVMTLTLVKNFGKKLVHRKREKKNFLNIHEKTSSWRTGHQQHVLNSIPQTDKYVEI